MTHLPTPIFNIRHSQECEFSKEKILTMVLPQYHLISSLLLLMHLTSASNLRITPWFLHRCDTANLLCWNSHHVDGFAVVMSLIYLREFLTFSLLPPQRSWGKVIFSGAYVKNSVHRGVSPGPHSRGG